MPELYAIAGSPLKRYKVFDDTNRKIGLTDGVVYFYEEREDVEILTQPNET